MHSTVRPPKSCSPTRRSSGEKKVTLTEDGFGFLTDQTTGGQIPIRSFTWSNPNRISVQVINYGATIVSFKIPDRKGHVDDIVMGYDDIRGYLKKNNPYFGATVGRVANRIKDGQFQLNGQIYTVTQNLGQHHLHGGAKGLDKVIWNYYLDGNRVIMTHVSKDCDEGYPGDVLYQVIFELKLDNRFVINHRATSTKATPINLTNHSYFNLAGHGAGKTELEKHLVLLNADSYTLADQEALPTGQIKSVANTLFDFQVPIQLGKVLNEVPGGGYDHNLCVTRGMDQEIAFVARVAHPPTGRVLEVYSNQPGVQFYTSNFLPEEDAPLEPECKLCDNYCQYAADWPPETESDACCKPSPKGSMTQSSPRSSFKNGGSKHSKASNITDTFGGDAGQNSISEKKSMGESKGSKNECAQSEGDTNEAPGPTTESGPKPVYAIFGKNGAKYAKHGALCLETQNYPDAINHSNFPNSVLNPGESYLHTVVYKIWLIKHP